MAYLGGTETWQLNLNCMAQSLSYCFAAKCMTLPLGPRGRISSWRCPRSVLDFYVPLRSTALVAPKTAVCLMFLSHHNSVLDFNAARSGYCLGAAIALRDCQRGRFQWACCICATVYQVSISVGALWSWVMICYVCVRIYVHYVIMIYVLWTSVYVFRMMAFTVRQRHEAQARHKWIPFRWHRQLVSETFAACRTDRQTDKKTDRQKLWTDMQPDRQTDRQT